MSRTQTQTASPSPEDSRPPADLPGWQTPPPPSRPDPLAPSWSTGPEGYAEDGDPTGSEDQAAADPGTTKGSTRTTPKSLNRLSEAGLKEAATTVAFGLGDALNGATALDEDDDVWEFTDEEADGIGAAAGRLMSRRIPDLPGGGADANDIADIIGIVVYAGVYLARNLATWLPRRRKAKKLEAAQTERPAQQVAAG